MLLAKGRLSSLDSREKGGRETLGIGSQFACVCLLAVSIDGHARIVQVCRDARVQLAGMRSMMPLSQCATSWRVAKYKAPPGSATRVGGRLWP